jgi:hypothetical protein
MAAVDTSELNGHGAYPRARTRDACMQEGIEQAGSAAASPSSGTSPRERRAEQHAAADPAAKLKLHAPFAEIVAPLEAVAGKRLDGSGLQACLVAFDESPEGFKRTAEGALDRGQVNPLGLLIKMVRDGDHLEEGRPATRRGPSAGRRGRKSSCCSSCGSVPLEKDQRLIIVGKKVGKALTGDDTCGICAEPLTPGAKGTIGELARLDPPVDELEFEIGWTHTACLRADHEARLEWERERSIQRSGCTHKSCQELEVCRYA